MKHAPTIALAVLALSLAACNSVPAPAQTAAQAPQAPSASPTEPGQTPAPAPRPSPTEPGQTPVPAPSPTPSPTEPGQTPVPTPTPTPSPTEPGNTPVPADTRPPQVIRRSPQPGQTNVPTSTKILIAFNEPVVKATAKFALSGGAAFSVTWDASSTIATLSPLQPLQKNWTYAVTVLAGVKDAAGNGTPGALTWSFQTAP